MDLDSIVARLEKEKDVKSVEGMGRVGISPDRTFGVKIPVLRRMAGEIKRDHELASQLWRKGIRETMILASMIDDPARVTEGQMEAWARDFYDWEVCDQTCANLFEKMPVAWEKAMEWSLRDEEFVKRAGFVLMARLAVSDKAAPDEAFAPFFSAIARGASDQRNMVKKSVNWALRQMGKRNINLNRRAVDLAGQIRKQTGAAARWIASDALRELTSRPVQARLEARERRKQAGNIGLPSSER